MKTRLVDHALDHMLNYMLDHMLDYIIIGLITMALYLYYLYSLLTNASISNFNIVSFLLQPKVLIYTTYTLSQLKGFWNLFPIELTNKRS